MKKRLICTTRRLTPAHGELIPPVDETATTLIEMIYKIEAQRQRLANDAESVKRALELIRVRPGEVTSEKENQYVNQRRKPPHSTWPRIATLVSNFAARAQEVWIEEGEFQLADLG
jgi:hypothetical protein